MTGLDAKFVGYLKCEDEDDVGQDVEEDEDEAHSEFEFHDVDVNDLNDYNIHHVSQYLQAQYNL